MTGKRSTPTPEQAAALAALRRTAKALARSGAARDVQIREASALGLSRRAVAEAAGITHGRVQQILDGQ